MSTGSIKTDDSALSKWDLRVHKIESFLNLLAGITILCLILLAVAQIFGRKFFNTPLPGFIDWVEQFMAVFALLGIAYCQRLGGHIRMDILVGHFRGRLLWLTEIISILLMMLVVSALIYGSYFHFLRAYENGDSSIDIGLPLWPAKLLVPIALSLLLIRLVLQLWGYIRAFRHPEQTPVAVPIPMDAAEQALDEARSVDSSTRPDST